MERTQITNRMVFITEARKYLKAVKPSTKYIALDTDGLYEYTKSPSICGRDLNLFKGDYVVDCLDRDIYSVKPFLISLAELQCAELKLEELPNCCKITVRDGDCYYNVNELKTVLSKDWTLEYTDFDHNLNYCDEEYDVDKTLDIMKIESPDGILLWQRETEVLEITIAELEAEKGCKVKIIK